MATDDKLDLVAAVPMFCRLGKRELTEVAGLLDEVDVPAGQVLMRQGEPGREMFLVISGTFRVDRNGHQIAERGPGSVLGEISLIAEGPRTATITATSAARLFVAGHREFHSLMDDHPAIKMQLLEGLADKIRVLEGDAAH